MNKALYIFIWAVLLSALGLSLLVVFWLTWPYKIFEFYTPRNEMITKKIKAGEHLEWKVDVNQLTNGVKIETQKQLQDGVIISYPQSSYITKKGRMTFNNITTVIPSYVPPGKYKIVIYNYAKVNPIRTILIVRETEDFEVIK